LKPMARSHSKSKKWFQFSVLLVCIGTCLQSTSKAQVGQPSPTHQKPLWSASPKQVGYNEALSYAFHLSTSHSYHPRIGGDIVKIQFLDPERLALAWLTPDDGVKKPVTRPIDRPSHLHLSILDAKNGQQDSYHEWACSSLGTNLAYTASGQWLLSSNESVTLFSSSFEKIRGLEHVKTQRGNFVSPSGRTFLLSVSISPNAWTPQLRDSTNLDVLDSWDDSKFAEGYFKYSDRFILAGTGKPPQLFIREVGKSWNPFSSEVDNSHPVTVRTYEFLNNDTVVKLLGHELVVETIGGTELFKQTVPEAGLFFASSPTSAITAGGERFAVILDRMRGLHSEPLDMYPFPSDDRVMVYSLIQRRSIFSLKVKGISPWYPNSTWNRIALPPDGLLLGIASDEGVRVYALPPTQSSP
jgi:hypothetical protein